MAIRGFGQLKVEFYSHLDKIKDLYFNQGIVVFKILHQKVIDKYNLTLDYQAFCYYARKELKEKGEMKIKDKVITQNIMNNDATINEPIISRPSFYKANVFN
ncbi:MAG: Unknown protein [uncultured Sulfurovum sp.]|uniref:Uncharacterized protein n=1 Tax=uncultured Sulfurovum sp. TaxID=269237 RepID=A0A6S6T7U4_9BACT|nr:MAG: Unknown protein [uncultured Sulfurovum sp.]